MSAPTFPNNWEYNDPNCCTNVITECIDIYGNLLAQENFDLALQEDEVSEIILG